MDRDMRILVECRCLLRWGSRGYGGIHGGHLGVTGGLQEEVTLGLS